MTIEIRPSSPRSLEGTLAPNTLPTPPMMYLHRSASRTARVMGCADTAANLSQFLNRALVKAQCITNATGAAIALIEGKEILCRVRLGGTAPDLGVRLKRESGISGECFRRGEFLYCTDAEIDSRVSVSVCQQLRIRSILALPVVHDGTVIGVFEVSSTQAHAFSSRQIDALEVLSQVIAAHIRELLAMKPTQLDNPAMSQAGSAAIRQSPYEPSRTPQWLPMLPSKPKLGVFVLILLLCAGWRLATGSKTSASAQQKAGPAVSLRRMIVPVTKSARDWTGTEDLMHSSQWARSVSAISYVEKAGRPLKRLSTCRGDGILASKAKTDGLLTHEVENPVPSHRKVKAPSVHRAEAVALPAILSGSQFGRLEDTRHSPF